ncbi:MAG TPA: alpha/beta hydrolase [Gemmatimonadaceae bacterium]|nr:alpha/beta hydrolase [Gemmatimonadaceae bacterium]
MRDSSSTPSPLRHRQVEVEGIEVHAVDGGASDSPAVLFLHGWPEDWTAFERIMTPLAERAHVVAIDLPGIGGSATPPGANDKRTLARYVHGVIEVLGLRDATLVGHDVGGMITYAYLRAYPDELARAVIMNTAIPGVAPWDEVKRNPHIWHFAFHAVPELPEKLVAGREAAYFDFFYDAIAARPGAVAASAREAYVEAYSRSEALHTGFEWYRAFPRDEADNGAATGEPVLTPVLYLRGEHERGDMQEYLRGLRDAGVRDIRGAVVPGSGHFAPNERPDDVAALLRGFIGLER